MLLLSGKNYLLSFGRREKSSSNITEYTALMRISPYGRNDNVFIVSKIINGSNYEKIKILLLSGKNYLLSFGRREKSSSNITGYIALMRISPYGRNENVFIVSKIINGSKYEKSRCFFYRAKITFCHFL